MFLDAKLAAIGYSFILDKTATFYEYNLSLQEHSEETQGLLAAGGGEKNGIEGIVVGIGIVGIEGMLGSGGKVTLGTAGIVGRLGIGGTVTLGTAGTAGIVGRLGSGRKLGCGRVGIEGIGGNVGLGKLGNCRRLRAASPPENDNAMKRAKIKQLKLAMLLMLPSPPATVNVSDEHNSSSTTLAPSNSPKADHHSPNDLASDKRLSSYLDLNFSLFPSFLPTNSLSLIPNLLIQIRDLLIRHFQAEE
ncbi:unnamed protein product [Dovyalis caffra]|uniref:Uncharacterized protein n=1 Tax=Dovyalis caffra TaxID=77055 RepID=A0AAV1SNU1_9ROSI|nr:unnamed protein product [Dovyalis caffra]